MSCYVRDSRESDVERIHSIYTHHVLHGTASFEEEPPSMGELHKRRADVLSHGLPFLVGEIDGGVAGYAYAGLYHTRSAYRFTLEDSVYVDHHMRRRGVGYALVRELLARCEQGPWRQMIAVIGDSANTGSIGLHEQFGFRLIGTLQAVGFKFERALDVVLMQRELRGK